jgi:nitronate monooxygenase
MNAYRGNLNNGYAFAGSNAFRAKAITTVKEVMDDLKAGFMERLEEFRR